MIVPWSGPGPARSRKPWQFGEDGRRIALGRRRLAAGKADFPLRHCETRDRVHQEQDVLVLVAEILGDRHGEERCLAAHQRRLVGGRDHHDRAGKARFAEVVLKEFLHFAAALADQSDHGDVAGRVARQHREQHRLADARAREDAEPLTFAGGGECVERPDAEIERPPTLRRVWAAGGGARKG